MDSTRDHHENQIQGPDPAGTQGSLQPPPPPPPEDPYDRGGRDSYHDEGRRGRRRRRPKRSGELPYKSSILAGFLSICPGLGQIYVGYYQRGLIHAAIVVALIVGLVAVDSDGVIVLFALSLAFFWLYNIVDAGRRATIYNLALDGGEGIDLPDDFKLPEGGSLAGGAILIVIGAITLLHTKFNLDLDWLEDWWPLIPIILGVWLIRKSRKKRT